MAAVRCRVAAASALLLLLLLAASGTDAASKQPSIVESESARDSDLVFEDEKPTDSSNFDRLMDMENQENLRLFAAQSKPMFDHSDESVDIGEPNGSDELSYVSDDVEEFGEVDNEAENEADNEVSLPDETPSDDSSQSWLVRNVKRIKRSLDSLWSGSQPTEADRSNGTKHGKQKKKASAQEKPQKLKNKKKAQLTKEERQLRREQKLAKDAASVTQTTTTRRSGSGVHQKQPAAHNAIPAVGGKSSKLGGIRPKRQYDTFADSEGSGFEGSGESAPGEDTWTFYKMTITLDEPFHSSMRDPRQNAEKLSHVNTLVKNLIDEALRTDFVVTAKRFDPYPSSNQLTLVTLELNAPKDFNLDEMEDRIRSQLESGHYELRPDGLSLVLADDTGVDADDLGKDEVILEPFPALSRDPVRGPARDPVRDPVRDPIRDDEGDEEEDDEEDEDEDYATDRPIGGPNDVDDVEPTTVRARFGDYDAEETQDLCRGDDKVRCGKTSVYICAVQWCDGRPDCPNGEDENAPECQKCEKDEFSCDGTRCISLAKKCDGHRDCSDGQDEADCPSTECTSNEFTCDDGRCIDQDRQCDGVADCSRGEDEQDCGIVECDESREFLCRSDNTCIQKEAVCDGNRDCSDGEDEICEGRCSEHEFHCNNGNCIPKDYMCNDIDDCGDNSDETDSVCGDYTCMPDEFTCYDGGCVSKALVCDDRKDCEDGTDEMDCDNNPPIKSLTRCGQGQFECNDGICIADYKHCNGIVDCHDESDETGCNSDPCSSNEFSCDGQCYEMQAYCNGVPDCSDGSDERNCAICYGDAFHCKNKQCILSVHICDGEPHCSDGSDELECNNNTNCKVFEWQCRNGFCINKDFRCDGSVDCTDRSDEEGCYDEERPSDPCREDEFYCDGRCFEEDRRCDGRADCTDGSDEHDCPTLPLERCEELQCPDGSCFRHSQRCDGVSDCADGYDEQHCPCRSNEFTCADGQCIPNYLLCNGRPDCADGSDERNCSCARNEFRCRTGQCIDELRRCDQRIDCVDGSDEKDCNAPPPPFDQPRLNLKTYPDEQTIKESNEVVFQCRDEGPMHAKVKWVRGNGQPLPPGTRDMNGRLEIPNIRIDHNGEYICEAVGYPKSTPGSSKVVQLTVERFHYHQRPPTACGVNEATCMNGNCILKSQICDGRQDCADNSDENGCSHKDLCEPNQFKCRNRKCVLKTWLCDGEQDCGDGSDEENCATLPPNAPCRHDEFQCRDGQCIPKSFQCDTHPDCQDKSDEVGCMAPAVIQPPPPSLSIIAGGVLNITCRATGVPVPLIVWRLNWGHVPEKCTSRNDQGFGRLTCEDMQPIDSGAYSCEIINTMGTHFVSPDTIVIVTGSGPVCQQGTFNSQARNPSDCINCFCFGVTTSCNSADLYTYALKPPVSSLTIVGVEGPWSGRRELVVGEFENHNLTAQRHGVQLRLTNLVPGRRVPYYSLPEEYKGNQLKSYGGSIRYDVEYDGTGRPVNAPDVILKGNGMSLVHWHSGTFYPDIKNHVSVSLLPGNWVRPDRSPATREDIMMALASIESILIRMQYVDGIERNIELVNVMMDSAAHDDRGLGSASLVEQCRCPAGYRGLSCESCDYGYVRQNSGPWLGRCVKRERECQPGYYGDPNRDIPCAPCPCPVAGEKSRARSCYLDSRDNVVCQCDRGYAGERCMECEDGYVGNPLGEGCFPRPVTNCNALGTERIGSDRRCYCKPGIEGTYCDRCAAQHFYMHEKGCVECFCMGLTNVCSSTTWVRDTIHASFADGRSGFSLISDYTNPSIVANALPVSNREIVYRNFGASDDTFYWRLPNQFLGNKLTSFGGHLNYTLRYTPHSSGGISRNSSPDVVLHSGNKIKLHHYRTNSPISPYGSNTHSVSIVEDEWQNYEDGNAATREYLLMALANVSDIFIKATYNTVSNEAALSYVSLDIARDSPYATGARAWPVEQCQCPTGHIGLSCEDCAPGYYKGDQGIYLGICEPCACNGHSDECDPQTGACINCRDNTYGNNCELCRPPYVGNATVGSRYDCTLSQPDQSFDCRECDVRGFTGNCQRGCECKQLVEGRRCDQCREGSFGLGTQHETGCVECFCSGVTKSCGSSNLYREELPVIVDAYDNTITLTDREGTLLESRNFAINPSINEISYTFRDRETYYWSLPNLVLGNQVLSYGANLTVTQYVEGGRPLADQDIILIGSGMKLAWSREYYDDGTYAVPLVEHNWIVINRRNSYPASRGDMLTVLSNLEHILIRATTKESTSVSRLSDITLGTAIPTRTPYPAVEVEMCRCPPGYRGTSCEQCEDLHYRDIYDRSAGLLGACKPCPCNYENADSCQMDNRGVVVCNCREGYSGDNCDNQLDTRPTVPPRNPVIEVVINVPSIKIVEIGEDFRADCTAHHVVSQSPIDVQWTRKNGRLPDSAYTDGGTLVITNIQIKDGGLYVCKASSGTEVVYKQVTINVSKQGSAKPTVLLSQPFIDQDEHLSAEVLCTATGYPTPTITWERVDQPLPYHAVTERGLLRFSALRQQDAGTYRCVARNDVGESDTLLTVYVRPAVGPTLPPSYPTEMERVEISPSSFDGQPGEVIRLICRCSPTAQVVWSKLGERQLPSNADVRNEMLIIEHASQENTGRYSCTAYFPNGRTKTSTVDVVIADNNVLPPSNKVAPRVNPLNKNYVVLQGADFSLSCEATGTPYPTVKWTLSGKTFESNVQQSGNVLRIFNAQPSNGGVYICVASNEEGMDRAYTVVEIDRREKPVLEIYPSEPQTIKVGESVRLSCRASAGVPYPSITWVRKDRMPLSSRFTNDAEGVITLRDASLEDAGEYECRADNAAGSAILSTTIEVLQPPIIRLQPSESHKITENDEFTIHCSATGKPAPMVTLLPPPGASRSHLRQQTEGLREVTLYLHQAELNDAGTYECTAKNAAGEDSQYLSLQVDPKRGDVGPHDDDDRPPSYYPPRLPPTRPPGPSSQPIAYTYKAILGEQAHLMCNEEFRSTRTEWRRSDGRPLPYGSIVRGGNLTIESTGHDAAGMYDCVTFPSPSQPVTIVRIMVEVISLPKISFSPQMPMTVRPGDAVDILCNVTSDVAYEVKWHRKDNLPLPPTVQAYGNYLRFSSIAPEDAGRYYCHVRNQFGETEKAAEVVVNKNELMPEPPIVGKRYHQASLGAAIRLDCKLPAGAPYVNVRYNWNRLERTLPPTARIVANGRELHLFNLEPEDAGTYQCGMSYPDGTVVYDSIVLTVAPESLPVLQLEPSRSMVRPGESLVVDCSSSAGTGVPIKWEKSDGTPLPYNIHQEGNRLYIQNAREDDSGTYTCVCFTEDGLRYVSDFQLEVEENTISDVLPRSTSRMEFAERGTTVKLQCNTDLYPTTYQWSRIDGELPNDRDTHGSILTLTNVQASDAGKYVCSAKHGGQSANVVITLVVNNVIPFFPQSPRSYMEFKSFDNVYSKFYFEVSFKPEKMNGLILYASQRRPNQDYISLSLRNGYPQFRFNFDGQQVVLQPEKPVHMGQWHTVKVNRVRNNGFLLVDDQTPVNFPDRLKFYGLNLDDHLFVGGVPQFDQVPASAVEYKEGFVGCISRLKLNDREVQLYEDALETVGITTCEPCADDPCKNFGTCLEAQTAQGYSCMCRDGYTGTNCQHEGDGCSDDTCGVGRCEETDTGPECYCPVHKTGDRCQYTEHYTDATLAFKDGSYAAYDKFQSKRSIRFRFKPDSLENGIMFYAAEHEQGYGDFMAVLLNNGFVEIRYSVAGKMKPLIVRSTVPIEAGQWHTVSAGRTKAGIGYLQVDDEAVNNEMSNRNTPILLKTKVYAGGYDKRLLLSQEIGVRRGFEGCIAELETSGNKLNMIDDIRDSANVYHCGHADGHQPDPIDVESPVTCRPGRGGYDCDTVTDICLDQRPCENGALCQTHAGGQNYTCTCEPGYLGQRCETQYTDIVASRFSGNGFIEVSPKAFKHSESQITTEFAIMFSAYEPNGLLIWYGQRNGEEFLGNDYVALSLSNGYVELTIRMDGQESYVRNSDVYVVDNERHVALVRRERNQFHLQVDSLTVHGETRPTGKQTMEIPGSFYVGGVPDVERVTGNRFNESFNGCVFSVENNEGKAILLRDFTIRTVNVDVCDEPNLGTDPPVV